MVLKWSLHNHYVWDTASWCPKNSCEKRYSNYFYLRPLINYDYKRSDASLCSTKSWNRRGSSRQFRWFALKHLFGLGEVRDQWNTGTEGTFKLLLSWWPYSFAMWLRILFLWTTMLSVSRKNLFRSEKKFKHFFHFWGIEVKYFAIV